MTGRLRVQVPAWAVGECSSSELTLCADSYSVRSPPRVTAVTHKRPEVILPKSADGRLHLTCIHFWPYEVKAGWVCCPSIRENELTRNSSGNTWQQSSQFAEPLWTDIGLKKWNWCVQADFHLKKKIVKKSAGREWIIKTSPQKTRKQGKSYHHKTEKTIRCLAPTKNLQSPTLKRK